MNLSDNTWPTASGLGRTIDPSHTLMARLQAWAGHAAAAWKERRQRAHEAEALYASSDRELWDMGFSRSDIPSILDGTYRLE